MELRKVKVEARLYGFEGAADRPARFLTLEMAEGSTVQDVIRGAGVPAEQVELMMVNGEFVESGTGVKAGDVISLSGPDDVASVGG